MARVLPLVFQTLNVKKIESTEVIRKLIKKISLEILTGYGKIMIIHIFLSESNKVAYIAPSDNCITIEWRRILKGCNFSPKFVSRLK